MSRWVWGLLLASGVGLAAPDGAGAARIVLRWKDVAGASAYELQIAKDSAFVEVVLQTRTTTAGYRWEELPSATHWWRVRSVDADGRPSEWSPPRTIAVDSVVPELKRPAEGASVTCGAPLEVELAASQLVKEYRLELSNNAAFTGATELKQATPVFHLGSVGVGVWHLRVRALDLKGKVVGPGPVRSFAVRVGSPKAKPVPDTLLGAAPLQLSWTEVACAKSWVIEATNDGKDRAALTSSTPQTSFKATVAGDYRWRVAGVDERGTSGEWSPESVVHVRLPVPAPKPEVVSGKVELSWTPVTSAVGYKVELGKVGSADEPQAATVTGTQWRSPDLEAGSWSWRVSAKDARGHVSAWSEARVFERKPFAPLSTPVLRAAVEWVPVGAPVVLEWEKIALASRYQIELDGQPLALVDGPRFETPALEEGWHQLRVRALQPPLRESAFSEPREVHAGPIPVAKARVEQSDRELEVRLYDKHEHPLEGTPKLSVRRGVLGEVVRREGAWVASWKLPDVGDDTLVIDDRDFHLEQPLPRPLPRAVWVAGAFGGIFNGGAVHSPVGALTLGVRLPLFARRLGLEGRVGVFNASSSATFEGLEYRANAWVVPVSLLLDWHQEFGSYVVRGAVGPAVLFTSVTVNQESALAAVPAVEVAASVSRQLGPGRLQLELGFLYGRLSGVVARLDAGGLSARVGYVFELAP